MMAKLLKARKFIDLYEDSHPKIKLTAEQWNNIQMIVMCLEPAMKSSKSLQSKELTLTDSYKIFNILQVRLSEIGMYVFIHLSEL